METRCYLLPPYGIIENMEATKKRKRNFSPEAIAKARENIYKYAIPARPHGSYENVGRPSVMTELNLQKLREAFLKGYTDAEACLFAGIGVGTLYGYDKRNPNYKSERELWKLNPISIARESVLRDMKINGELALKYLERKLKNEFSLRTENQTDNEITIRLETFTKPDGATALPPPIRLIEQGGTDEADADISEPQPATDYIPNA